MAEPINAYYQKSYTPQGYYNNNAKECASEPRECLIDPKACSQEPEQAKGQRVKPPLYPTHIKLSEIPFRLFNDLSGGCIGAAQEALFEEPQIRNAGGGDGGAAASTSGELPSSSSSKASTFSS